MRCHDNGQGDHCFICSGTDQGTSFVDGLQRTGLPRHLVDAGFANIRNFWTPWCAALDGGVIAAMALRRALAHAAPRSAFIPFQVGGRTASPPQ
jgi:hypothetical protein